MQFTVIIRIRIRIIIIRIRIFISGSIPDGDRALAMNFKDWP